ncbi:MAG: sugar phosphate nucleotidyltransferase [archaeon]
MDALILAAGDGTRLHPATRDTPKVMLKIWGVPILERSLYNLRAAGVRRIVIAVGYKAAVIRRHFGNSWDGMTIEYVRSNWVGDGIMKSAVAAESRMNGRFILLSGDSIPSEELLKKAIKARGDIVVTVRNSDEDGIVAKVAGQNIVTQIGMREEIGDPDFTVAGVSVCTPDFFKAARACLSRNKAHRSDPIQWMIEQKYQITSVNISKNTLIEIDTFDDLKKAREIIFREAWNKRLKARDINIFKRIFNLPVSLRLTRLFAHTGLDPIVFTLASLASAIGGGILFGSGAFALGGIFCYIATIIDAIDGKLSRLQLKTTLFGGYIDSVSDRLSEFSIVLGLTYGTYSATQNPRIIILGFVIWLGWIGRFYIKELFMDYLYMDKKKFSYWRRFQTPWWNFLGDRDFNSFALFMFCLAGWPVYAMVFMAATVHLFLFRRSWQIYTRFKDNGLLGKRSKKSSI